MFTLIRNGGEVRLCDALHDFPDVLVLYPILECNEAIDVPAGRSNDIPTAIPAITVVNPQKISKGLGASDP